MNPHDPVFVSERLIARRWTGGEVEDLLAVYGDADAMRWVGDGVPISRAQCERWLEVTRTNYETRGYGMFTLEDRATGRTVGFGGLVHPGGQPEAELKYALLRSHWGCGLATEAAAALIAYGQRVHRLDRIIATTAPQNAASHAVLLKAGFARGELRTNDDGSRTQVFVWHASAASRGEQPRIGVGVIVVRSGLVLLGERMGAHGAGTWALPGGHLEFGESIEACAAREVLEETGLVITTMHRGPYTNDVMRDEGRHYVTLFVLAQAGGGDARTMEPGKCKGWCWFPWSGLPERLFQPLQTLVRSGFVPPGAA